MDRNFYYQTQAKEHQREISRELATRNLLKHGKRETLTANQAKRVVWQMAPAVILMTILLVGFLR
jgi:hypothetical protein